MDFALWTPFHLSALAKKLSEACTLTGDGFAGPPLEEDAFWSEAATIVRATSRVAQPLSPRVMTPAALSSACRDAIEVLDISEICAQRLYLSDISSATSPLGRALLSIKGVVVVPPVGSEPHFGYTPVHRVEVSKPLAEQLPAAVSFIRQLDGPVLICSTTGRGVGAAVCAAALAADDGLSAPMAITEVARRRGAPLRVERDEEQQLQSFCDAFLRMEFTLRLGSPASRPRSSPHSTPTMCGAVRPLPPDAAAAARSPLKRAQPSSPVRSPRSKKHAGGMPPDGASWSSGLDQWRLDM